MRDFWLGQVGNRHGGQVTRWCRAARATACRRCHSTLWEQHIITRYVPERNGIRISTPYFTSEEELDRLIAALERLTGESGR
jgi:selenocysteine lyase/cysteine desulfurase